MASLLEGMALIKTTKEDALDKVQQCIARASKHQLDVKIPQVEIMILLLDLACSMHQKNPETTLRKLLLLQRRMDQAVEEWAGNDGLIMVPFAKQPQAILTISKDTSAIMLPGLPEAPEDYIVLSYFTRPELGILM
jgi:hypothetical protein